MIQKHHTKISIIKPMRKHKRKKNILYMQLNSTKNSFYLLFVCCNIANFITKSGS